MTRAVLCTILMAMCAAASVVAAAPVTREEARQVSASKPFEVTLTYHAGTGTTWLAKDLTGVTVLSEDKPPPTASMPGAARLQVFRLVAPQPGQFVLVWELTRDGQTIYEVYRLRLEVAEVP
jgi:hypothetical protein